MALADEEPLQVLGEASIEGAALAIDEAFRPPRGVSQQTLLRAFGGVVGQLDAQPGELATGLELLQIWHNSTEIVLQLYYESADFDDDGERDLLFLPVGGSELRLYYGPFLNMMVAPDELLKFAVLAGGVEAPAEISGWKRVATGEVPGPTRLRGGAERRLPYAVYENPRVWPRAFVVGQVQAALPGESALGQLANLNAQQEVLLSRDVLEGGERQAFLPVEVKRASAAEMQLDVLLQAPGYLCVMETYYPGWRAEVDGKPVELLQANIAFRGVPLSRGKHQVVLSYRPPGGKMAVGVFVTTVMLLLGFTYRARLQEKQAGGTEPTL